jgi:hypothetical protein
LYSVICRLRPAYATSVQNAAHVLIDADLLSGGRAGDRNAAIMNAG